MELKQEAKQAIKQAGNYLREQFRKHSSKSKKKAKGSLNLVTEADYKSEEIITNHLQQVFPGHTIIGEESDNSKESSGYAWYIDPVDGTNNFARRIPHFCISIALYQDNDPIMGMVYQPILDQLFYAESDSGTATLNGEEIKVSNTSNIPDSIFITGFSYDKSGKESLETAEQIKQLLKHNVGGIRRLSSAALDICYVACGKVEGYWEYDLSPWDYAASSIILNEAGGEVTTPTGETYSIMQHDIACSNGTIHDDFLKVLAKS